MVLVLLVGTSGCAGTAENLISELLIIVKGACTSTSRHSRLLLSLLNGLVVDIAQTAQRRPAELREIRKTYHLASSCALTREQSN